MSLTLRTGRRDRTQVIESTGTCCFNGVVLGTGARGLADLVHEHVHLLRHLRILLLLHLSLALLLLEHRCEVI